jgi:tetratricopeptide (TPR) repeat protein
MKNQFRQLQCRIAVIISMLFLLPHFSTAQQGQDAAVIWESANRYYTSGQYDSAQELYLQLLTSDPGNIPLLYNLGNTYYRLNDMPHAVLYYQKVLRAQPRHQAARQNLALAESRINGITPVQDAVFFIKWWNALTATDTTNIWASIAFIFFILILFILYLKSINKLSYSGRYLLASVMGFIITTGCAIYSYQHYVHYNKSVVMEDHALLLEEPKAAAKVLGNIPSGSTVRKSEKQAGYVKIALRNGRSGWIDSRSLEDI